VAQASDEDDGFWSYPGSQDIDLVGGSFIASLDFESWELKYLAGHRRYEFLNQTDLDGSPYAIFHIGWPGNDNKEKSRQSSHELTLSGTTLGEKLRYTTGLYYFDERSSNFGPQEFPTAFGGLGFLTRGGVVSRVKSWALYGQGSYDLTERLSFTAGIRSTYEKREATRDNEDCSALFQLFFGQRCFRGVSIAPGALPFQRVNRPDVDDRWDSVTWLAGLDFRVTDELFLYAKASKGYRSGGFNGRANDLVSFNEPFDEELVTTYETGAKADWLDDRLRTNLALYFSKFKEEQITTLVPTSAGVASIIINSGSADVSGGELELWAQPLDGLNLGGTLGVTLHRRTKGPLSGGLKPVPALPGGLCPGGQTPLFVSGVPRCPTSRSDPHNVPRFTYSVFAEYTQPVRDLGELSARLDFYYQSDVEGTNVNGLVHTEDVVRSNNHGVLNGRIAWFLPDLNTEIAVFGRNLLDRIYNTTGVDFAGPNLLGFWTRYYAPRRKWGVEVTYRFGSETR
jgi:iron complex outermembrane receptor protein